jgi:hypothetical protein
MQGAITGRRHGSAQAERRAKAKLALVAAAAAALLAQGYPTPNWTPIYNMSESTIVQPCNYSGLYNPRQSAPGGSEIRPRKYCAARGRSFKGAPLFYLQIVAARLLAADGVSA